MITGIHILGGGYSNEIKKLNSLWLSKKVISRTIKDFNLHELGSFYHKFPNNGGFTGIISLTESHIAIHTWPELKYLTLDVYLCNYSNDNSTTGKKIFDKIIKFYKPSKIIKKLIVR